MSAPPRAATVAATDMAYRPLPGQPPRAYRGSRRRLRRVTLGGNWSIELLVIAALTALLLFVISRV